MRSFALVFLLAGCGGSEFGTFGAAPSTTDGRAADSTEDGGPGGAPTVDDAGNGGSSGAVGAGDGEADVGRSADSSAPTCVTDLSGVGTDDFQISFTLTTSTVPAESTYMALLNQRSSCDDTRPGWDVWMTAQGNLGVEVYDGSGSAYDNVTDSRPINDGVPHHITVARAGSSLTIDVDGVSNTYPNQPIMPLATLSPMNVGIDPTCTGVRAISGRLVDVCLTAK
jgi:hypothetical protein